MTQRSPNHPLDAGPAHPLRSTAARRAPGAIACGVALALAASTGRAEERNIDLGPYGQHYVRVIYSNEDWLVHPTGSYADLTDKKNRKQYWYEPDYRETDDMDGTIQEMIDRGYVMIGYSAFNSAQAGPSLEDDPAYASMTPTEQAGYRLGLKLRGNLRAAENPLGDPRDAARWANAAVIVLQRDFAFSRDQAVARRVVASDLDERTESRGSQYTEQRGSQFQEVGNTKGDSEWVSDSQAGSVYQEQDGTVRHQSRQYSTILLDRTVDHYDYFATFWKKADPRGMVIGAVTGPVPAELRPQIGTRHGRMVTTVVAGTPAYQADLWEGDVLLEIEGESIVGEEGWDELLERYQGQPVTVTVWREGQVYAYPVRLNPRRSAASAR